MKLYLPLLFVTALGSMGEAATVVQGNDDTSKQNCVQQLVQAELSKNKVVAIEITRVASSGLPLPAGPRRFSYTAKNAQNLNFFGTILVNIESNDLKTQCGVSSGSILGVSLNSDVFTFNQQLIRY